MFNDEIDREQRAAQLHAERMKACYSPVGRLLLRCLLEAPTQCVSSGDLHRYVFSVRGVTSGRAKLGELKLLGLVTCKGAGQSRLYCLTDLGYQYAGYVVDTGGFDREAS